MTTLAGYGMTTGIFFLLADQRQTNRELTQETASQSYSWAQNKLLGTEFWPVTGSRKFTILIKEEINTHTLIYKEDGDVGSISA